MPDQRYHNWVKEAWKELDRDFTSGMFSPRNEKDIQAHLYHCMFEHRPENYRNDRLLLVTTEWEIPNDGRKIDLAIIRVRNASRSDARSGTDELRLTVEVKETSREELSAGEVSSRVQEDIDKMAKAAEIGNSWVSDNTRKPPVMVFFFLGASRRGLATGVAREMDGLAQEVGKRAVFLYGPLGNL